MPANSALPAGSFRNGKVVDDFLFGLSRGFTNTFQFRMTHCLSVEKTAWTR